MMKICFYHLLLLVMLTCAGCAVFVQEPRISIDSTNIIGIDTSGVDIEFSVSVENPNSFELVMQSYAFELQVMALPFSRGGSQMKFVFPAGQQSHIRLPMRVSYGDLIEVVMRCPDLDRIPFYVEASLKIETPLGELLLPVNKTDVISVPESYRPSTYLKRFMKPLGEMR